METEATINFQGFAEAGRICKEFFTTDENLHIQLKSHSFYPNEKVHGKVIFRAEQPLKPEEIRIEVKGTADTSFYVTNKITTKNTTVDRTRYYYTEKYLNYYKTLWKSGKKDDTLFPGDHEFFFEFKIPDDAPPSIDEGQGKVKYMIKAIVETPWKLNSETKAEITVLPYLNLNEYKGLDKERVAVIDRKRWFSSRKISAKATIPKTGYAPGEVIPLTIEIDNGTTRDVIAVETGILQTYTFTGYYEGTKTSKYKKKVYSNRKFNVQAVPFTVRKGEKKVFTDVIKVPVMMPTLEECSNISLEYDVLVEIQTNGLVSSKTKTSLPIIVGTVPLEPKD